MAQAYVQSQPGRVVTGRTAGRMTADGALYEADQALANAIEGRVFAANGGSVTTPLTTAATTAIVNTTPHAWVRVPDGTAIIPVYAKITIESSGITTQGEASVIICQNDIGNGTSTAADSGQVNLNTAGPGLVTSNCTARVLATGAATAPTNPIELQRFSWALSTVNTSFEFTPGLYGIIPILRGPATWAIYLGGNAVVYYSQMVWRELPESSVS